MQPCLYLIPVTLGETSIASVLPEINREIILTLKYFIVEDIRSARRFLKKNSSDIDIDQLVFFELNKHTTPESISAYLKPMRDGFSIGVLSEAGCPAIADPGAVVVGLAQQNGLKVVPLVGPSSILMSLMASGFNGQSFSFNGYLPIDGAARVATLKRLEQRIYIEDQTQIFIETPYRNHKMIEDILKNCKPQTKLCIATNLTCDDEQVVTKTLKEWQSIKIADLSKKPTVFLIFK